MRASSLSIFFLAFSLLFHQALASLQELPVFQVAPPNSLWKLSITHLLKYSLHISYVTPAIYS